MEETQTSTFTPSLTFGEPEAPAAPAAEPETQKGPDDSILSAEEKKMVEDFSKKIDLHNSTGILEYGVGAQKKLADFSDKALNKVKTKDLGEVGNLVSGLVTELKSFDVQEEEKGLFGFLKKGSNKMTAMRAKYASAETNVNKIVDVLEGHQVQLLKDVAMLDTMYDENLAYYKELTMYILAGKKRLEQVKTEELPALRETATRTGLAEDAQRVKDLQSQIDRFEKKLYDLELTRAIAMQTAPQIRLVQNSDTVMAEKIQSTIVNTIPLWKSQMVIALGVEHSMQAAKAEREVTDMTNELLKKNAKALKTATIETAKEAERGIVEIETVRETNESLISTLDELLVIQTEGREKRAAAEAELRTMEDELKKKLLEVRR